MIFSTPSPSNGQEIFESEHWHFISSDQTPGHGSIANIKKRNKPHQHTIHWPIDKKKSLYFYWAHFYLKHKISILFKQDIFPFNIRGNLFYCYLKLKKSNKLARSQRRSNDKMIDLFIMLCNAILKLKKCNIEDIHLYHWLVFISVIECYTPLYLLSTCHY